MAALGWLLNLGFAGGGIPIDSRVLTVGESDREFKPAVRVDCVVPSSDRTFTPADE